MSTMGFVSMLRSHRNLLALVNSFQDGLFHDMLSFKPLKRIRLHCMPVLEMIYYEMPVIDAVARPWLAVHGTDRLQRLAAHLDVAYQILLLVYGAYTGDVAVLGTFDVAAPHFVVYVDGVSDVPVAFPFLDIAVIGGSLAAVAHLVQHDVPDSSLRSAMEYAAANGHLAIVEALARRYPSTASLALPLLHTAKGNHVDVVDYFLPRCAPFEQSLALNAAVRRGAVHTTRRLLEVIEFFHGDEWHLESPAQKGQLDVLRLVLDNDIYDLGHRSWMVERCVWSAVCFQQLDTVAWLLSLNCVCATSSHISRAGSDGKLAMLEFL
ncbi:Aste57867_1976 [Aphanomyces stellatus]|uniref:Aste57867_1976 protein n=1 Tax=Aphanomyces stellatus TaxID=120398 RepID=A0A485KAS8_9STRA|nr:hypothetical protein As57867_001974 [Aphanomyces stellatus]VFT79181.1 Aste57867_1976 [Aphanomyces stellatus]